MRNSIRKFFNNADILVILLLIYITFTTIFRFFVTTNAEVTKLILNIDFILSVIIGVYFWVALYKAPNRKQFMRWGWVILLAALPPIWIVRDLWEYMQLLRLIILVQFFYNSQQPTKMTLSNKLFNTLMLAVFIVLISTILVLHFESVPEAKITTAGEAIYWAIVTISTVGYGDFYPVTPEGRVITIFLIFSGVSIFVSAAGYFASWISSINQREQEHEADE